MFANEKFSAARAATGCAGLALLALVGCSSRNTLQTDTTASAMPPPAPAAAAQGPQTDTEALGDAGLDNGTTTTVIQNAGPALKASAPKDYVVKRGDTLWGIANMFLKDPWLWPEIWYVNPDIHNPHRIYPGDTIHLALAADGHTSLQVLRTAGNLPYAKLEPMLRSQPLDNAIPTIPYATIAAFLERPGVLSKDEIKKAPYILALRGEHDIAGSGDELYVKKMQTQVVGARFAVMHVDEELHDPDGHRHLGYLAVYTGTAQLVRPGPIAKAMLTDSHRETLQGDVLVSEDSLPTSDFQPHTPARPVHGRVVAVVAGADVAGQYDVVAINRGSDDGLERGDVLTADEVQEQSDDQCAHIHDFSTCLRNPTIPLPTEAAGTLLVFKTYPQMSYALVLHDTVPIMSDARVSSP